MSNADAELCMRETEKKLRHTQRILCFLVLPEKVNLISSSHTQNLIQKGSLIKYRGLKKKNSEKNIHVDRHDLRLGTVFRKSRPKHE